jgi:hypothetical protein
MGQQIATQDEALGFELPVFGLITQGPMLWAAIEPSNPCAEVALKLVRALP